MGFDNGILYDEFHPEWSYKKEYKARFPMWHVKAYPGIWTHRSTVWYSQEIIKKLGREKFQNYVNQWNYGNRDLSRNPGKNDGLTRSWLVSNLQISVMEQVDFLSKLLQNQLHVSKEAHRHTQNILFSEELSDAWEFYVKTGRAATIKRTGL
ncbi:penicillin-binding transpeptidase domain-containing protein [Bacteroidetes bacterium endosymbiont of Geopemphigus sp.]|uniref:penicillin-binding transpeptidase domain-containing protein n=1 Tax=Bacteroidetes bacterium endosymbiont of Geopemphigus sp. TaxID=2047937 RepID=UPI000CD1C111|nr:penicillin-binding transpeptidase domain-containing protein [Bacteroidetes bacterium endosymbiont of Geopemphigus sp.]